MRTLLPLLAILFVLGCKPPNPLVLESTTALSEGDDPFAVEPDALTIPALGARDPRVIVSLFTDYECPNCKRMHGLVDRWPEAVQVQFRQMPLDGHERAEPTACAAIAAHRQGRFACMHSALTRTRASWRELAPLELRSFIVRELAPWCGLDPARFERDLDDPKVLAFVRQEREIARDLGVRGTPTVLVNGLEATLWPRPGVNQALLLNALVRRVIRDAESAAESGAVLGFADLVRANLGDDDKTALLLGLPNP
jgi:protein-disulfide isomerase